MMAPQKPLQVPRRPRKLCAKFGTLLLLAAVSLSGCNRGARRSVELLESRIRNQEETIASLRRDVSTLEAEREATPARGGRFCELRPNRRRILCCWPSMPKRSFRVSEVSINTYPQRRSRPRREHGDELLTVLVVPQDNAGDTLRATGKLEIDVFDFAAPTGQQRIGHWDFDRDQTRELWHFGLIGRGIQITVPWQTPPVSGNSHRPRRLTMPDGRSSTRLRNCERCHLTRASRLPQRGYSQFPHPMSDRQSSHHRLSSVPSAFPPIESAEPTTIESVPPPAFDSGTPGFEPAESELPASDGAANLQPPLLPEFEARRAISLTARGWQSTTD